MKNYFQITITCGKQEDSEMIMALLGDFGYEGFEETGQELLAYIDEDFFDEKVLQQLKDLFDFSYTAAPLQHKNWNEEWEKNFQPVIVDEFVYVRADFHQPDNFAEHEIIITPKMSFGTGHHATTYMMMQQMRNIDFCGKTVFDFGTGTGILAILAEKLGAKKIVAVDNDEFSISNADENIKRNNCTKIELRLSSEISTGEYYDIILANINKNVIVQHLSAAVNRMKGNAHLLVSGLLAKDKADIMQAAQEFPLQVVSETAKDKWICIKFLANRC